MPSHLTAAERDRIAQLSHRGFNQKEMAAALQRSPATISRELRRNSEGSEYHACQAQNLAQSRRSERPLTQKLDRPELQQAVRDGLANHWAPEQIAGRLRSVHEDLPNRHVSAPTIYAWIRESDDREHWSSFLRRRGKRPNRRKKGSEMNAGSPIANRPEIIEGRLRLGDFEGDTVLGPAGTGGIVTLVDRRSRYTIMTKISSKDAEHVHHRIKLRLKALKEKLRRSITFDNGTEFARCHRLEKHLGMKLYFADPGCPHQRGTNENTNGLIRQFVPKGTDFRGITHNEVSEVETLLNGRPRECLGFRTPNEVFFEQHHEENCI
jgi:transposase, IS30 family